MITKLYRIKKQWCCWSVKMSDYIFKSGADRSGQKLNCQNISDTPHNGKDFYLHQQNWVTQTDQNLKTSDTAPEDAASLQYPFLILHTLLFSILLASNLFHFNQIKRRYWINDSDAFSIRLFYPIPSCVIIALFLINKAAEISPPTVWFPPHVQIYG